MQDELAQLAEHRVAIVPHAVEAQHLAVHLEELAQPVEVGRRRVGAQLGRLGAPVAVRVGGARLRRAHHHALARQEVLWVVTPQCGL